MTQHTPTPYWRAHDNLGNQAILGADGMNLDTLEKGGGHLAAKLLPTSETMAYKEARSILATIAKGEESP